MRIARRRVMATLMAPHAVTLTMVPLLAAIPMALRQLATIIGKTRVPMRGGSSHVVRQRPPHKAGDMAESARQIRLRHRAILSNRAMATMPIDRRLIPGANRIITGLHARQHPATITIGIGRQRGERQHGRPKRPFLGIRRRPVPAATSLPIPADPLATAMMTIGVMMMSGSNRIHHR